LLCLHEWGAHEHPSLMSPITERLATGYVRALLYGSVTGREERFNGNRNQPNYLSTMEPGKVEIGAEILLRIGREFGRVLNGC
jgi:hypothetical protein